jgi:hypothetical protein
MKIFQTIVALVAVFAVPVAKAQAPTQASTGIGTIQSVFILPASPAEGRDPFYPESTRAIEAAAAANQSQNHTVEITSLKVPGVSGTPGHFLAIINTHTFAVGEEGDLKTSGGSVHIRCLDIRPDAVMVEINGQVHRLPVEDQ